MTGISLHMPWPLTSQSHCQLLLLFYWYPFRPQIKMLDSGHQRQQVELSEMLATLERERYYRAKQETGQHTQKFLNK
jgi:hypothetical protein